MKIFSLTMVSIEYVTTFCNQLMLRFPLFVIITFSSPNTFDYCICTHRRLEALDDVTTVPAFAVGDPLSKIAVQQLLRGEKLQAFKSDSVLPGLSVKQS